MARNSGIEFLRIVAIFTVVMIHSGTTDMLYRDAILRYMPPANACFAFLAGWFLFKRQETRLQLGDIGRLVLKRIKRLIVPYLVWELVYVFVNMGFDFVSRRGGGTIGGELCFGELAVSNCGLLPH